MQLLSFMKPFLLFPEEKEFFRKSPGFLYASCNDTVILATPALSPTITYRYQDTILNNQDIFNQGN